MILIALLFALRIDPDTPEVQLKQPQLAIEGQTVALTYGAGNSLYFSSSVNGADSFSKPVKVATGTYLALGRHRGPRIAFAKDTVVISAITGVERGKDGDLLAWRSNDGGKTWSAPARISDVPAAAREGLHAMTSAADGSLFASWLDLRDSKMKLYGSTSRDGGATWSKNELLYASPDGQICTCCHPSIYAMPDGKLHVMWRNDLGGSRDMWLASSVDRGKTWKTQKLGNGTWPLNACPMDGGGMSADASGNLQTAWRRDGEIFLAQPGKPEHRIGKGKDPAIAGNYIAWTDGTALKYARPGTEPKTLTDDGAFVTLTGTQTVYAAWEEKGSILVRRLQD